MSKGSVADQSGKLNIGDRLLSVNGKSLEYVTYDDAIAAISTSINESNEIYLTVAKITKYTTILSNASISPSQLITLNNGASSSDITIK